MLLAPTLTGAAATASGARLRAGSPGGPQAGSESAAARTDSAETLRESLRPGAATYLRRGLDYLARPRPEDQDEADRLFRKALGIDPDLARAHAGLAQSAVYRYTLGLDPAPQRMAQALDRARHAVDLGPDDTMTRATLALALAAADRLTPAREEARRAVDLDPEAAGPHVALGIILRLLKQHDAAVTACRRAAALEPDSPRVLAALAAALRENGLYSEALDLYGQAIDLDHEAIVPQIGAAATLHRAGHLIGAERAFRHLLDQWDYARDRVLQGYGAVLLSSQDYEGALAAYGRVELPGGTALPNLLTLYGRGYCLLRLDRPAEAEYFLTSLIDRVPPDYDGPARGREMLFRAYEDLADYFEGRGRERKTDRLLRAACERPLAPTRLARRLAARLAENGQRDEAAARLEAALLGADPLEDAIDLSESVIAFARLRSRDGARSLGERGAAAEAMRLAAERIASSPFGVAHYRLARAQALAGDPQAALTSLTRARERGFLPVEQTATERDFESLRDEAAFKELLRR